MNRRKVIGWLLLGLGIPFYFVVTVVSKEITGHFTIGILITALIMGGGWILAHPKRRLK